MEFNDALNNWLKAVDQEILYPQANYAWVEKNQVYITLEAEDGQKFVKIYSVTLGDSRSAWAFVAKDNGSNKQLGDWKKGDIFKPASWKAPAKHARGNIFDLTKGPTCGISQWTGPSYLK